MQKKMVVLIGEQAIPNLLPVFHIKPKSVLLVSTKFTQQTSQRLEAHFERRDIKIQNLFIQDPYNIRKIYSTLEEKLNNLGWVSHDLIINITGGTKPMSIAAYQLAIQHRYDTIYLQSEKHQSQLRWYNFDIAGIIERSETLPTLITIDDYLRAYLPGYRETGFSRNKTGQIDAGGRFEKVVLDALQPYVDEIIAGVRPDGVKDQIEIDLVIRCGNQVGIAEVKTGGADKRGLDQLSTAGGRAYLGTYTAKFWIVGARNLRSELRALAIARNIAVIHLPRYMDKRPLSLKESRLLTNTVLEKLGCLRR